MMFELAHVPFPDGYGEALVSLDACKAHLSIEADETEFDELIKALRDAAIEYVERYCSVKLGPVTGMVWSAEGLPVSSSDAITLGVWPVTQVTNIVWRDGENVEVVGDANDFRVTAKGALRPVVGGAWPSGVAGAVQVTFDAGFAAGDAPPALIAAVRMMLAHFFRNREAIITGTISAQTPLGVTALCAPFRPVLI